MEPMQHHSTDAVGDFTQILHMAQNLMWQLQDLFYVIESFTLQIMRKKEALIPLAAIIIGAYAVFRAVAAEGSE